MADYLIYIALAIVVSIIGGAFLMALRKPFAEEIGYQIDRIPERVFFAALRFFPEDERERRYDQWAEDYQELSDAYEKRTLVRIWKCTGFSLNLLAHSGFIGRRKPAIRLRKWRRAKTEHIMFHGSDYVVLTIRPRSGGVAKYVVGSKGKEPNLYSVKGKEFANKDDARKYAAKINSRKRKQAEQ